MDRLRDSWTTAAGPSPIASATTLFIMSMAMFARVAAGRGRRAQVKPADHLLIEAALAVARSGSVALRRRVEKPARRCGQAGPGPPARHPEPRLARRRLQSEGLTPGVDPAVPAKSVATRRTHSIFHRAIRSCTGGPTTVCGRASGGHAGRPARSVRASEAPSHQKLRLAAAGAARKPRAGAGAPVPKRARTRACRCAPAKPGRDNLTSIKCYESRSV